MCVVYIRVGPSVQCVRVYIHVVPSVQCVNVYIHVLSSVQCVSGLYTCSTKCSVCEWFLYM